MAKTEMEGKFDKALREIYVDYPDLNPYFYRGSLRAAFFAGANAVLEEQLRLNKIALRLDE